jgi:HNH endonuclease
MSNNSNARKDATLGMPHGTANGRLRKMIIFNLLKKHGENVCVRCSLPILLIEDLSIEHIKPWEGISAELFWDLNNIAFSHMACNRPHRSGHAGGTPRKIGPEGTAWCTKCQKFEPAEKFGKRVNHWNGLDDLCQESRREFRKTVYSSMARVPAS